MIEASKITDGLWQGSVPPFGRTLSRSGFGVVVLCAQEHQPSADNFPGVDVARIDLIDDGTPLTRDQFKKSLFLSAHLCRAMRRGSQVLVTCMQGRNRSGLIAALTLARATGCDGHTATRAIQERRNGPFGPALTNSQYVKALKLIPAAPSRGLITSQAAMAARLTG